MGLRIEELGSMYASLFHVRDSKPEKGFPANEAAGGACDSYIASVNNGADPCSTGNYDDNGMMDDDFSVNLSDKAGEPYSAAQYSADYAEQRMKVITKSEQSDGEMKENNR